MSSRKKILFFSHAVTMAHFSRPLKWIESMDTEKYEIYLASHPKFKSLVPQDRVQFIDISCIDAAEFSEAVGKAAPIYDKKNFEEQIQEDLKVMGQVQPDLVIGDFRHSLSVSCRLQKIKYVNMTNAYWSPKIKMNYPLPEAPVIRQFAERFARTIMAPIIPFVLKFSFFKMVYSLRKPLRRAGLFFSDYRQLLIDGDVTVYCDTPSLVPLKTNDKREKFVGPVVWSVNSELPSWWSELDKTKKRIFLTLGSSGPADSLPLIISTLAKLDVEIVVALAGKKIELPNLHNVYVTDFLPLEEACAQSDLVICNGGSPMCHAALTYGVPTVGIICNNDQLLNMAHIEKRGAGKMLRYWNLTSDKILASVEDILENSKYFQNCQQIKQEFKAINVNRKLQTVIEDLLA